VKGRLAEILVVSTAGNHAEPPPLLGTHAVEAGVLLFRPKYPLEPGVRYRAVVSVPGRPPIAAEFALPKKPPGEPVSVVRVSPTPSVLPENLLKFYIEFSGPMSRGEAYEHLHLLDGAGKPIAKPFLELGEELWDPRGVRFTLFFDPGRIKKGLRPREDLGPVLENGKSYTLVIDGAWHDAERSSLRSEYRKSFRAGPADTTTPDPKTWRIEPPVANSLSPLVARFAEPLDRALLGRTIAVVDDRGQPVEGVVLVGSDETSWSFKPTVPWKAGGYSLVVDRTLEDVAGNGIGRPFEVDVFQKVDQVVAAEPVSLTFTVAGSK
jgi:hypothetical protein